MNNMRVMAPETEDSPNTLARMVRGAIDGVYAFLDLHLIPAAPGIADVIDVTPCYEPHARPAETNGPTMFRIYAAKLTGHVRRVEHILRCLLFLLAAKLMSDPKNRARLSVKTHPYRPHAQRRPFDPEILVQITQPAPRASFVILPCPSRSKSPSHGPRRYIPFDWQEVEMAHLLARMAALPKVLNALEKRAETLAARLLSGEIAFSRAELKTPSIRRLGGFAPYERERKKPVHCPAFLRHIAHWLPPPELYMDCHPDDRETYNKLHSLAYEAASVCQ